MRPLFKPRFFHTFHLIKPFLWRETALGCEEKNCTSMTFFNITCKFNGWHPIYVYGLNRGTSLLQSGILCASNAPLVHRKPANDIRTSVNNIVQDERDPSKLFELICPHDLAEMHFLWIMSGVGQWIPRNSKKWPGKAWPPATLICVKWIAEI